MTVVLLLLLSGCSFFSRTKNNIYSLDQLAGTRASVRGTPVAIESLELPPGFDRREIVVRKADHLLDVRSNELWSADMQPLVLHTLAFDLASRLPEGMVILPGEVKPATLRPIDIVFADLSAGPDAKINVDAQWKIGGVTHREVFAIDVPSLDSKNIATGMSQALAQLADRIAAGNG
ncbi:MAG TPA: ABC-type transport auxiliary lipoprotein family protein [Thermoanaerobaculia bacterium]|nr:ABC-type transport auxiliary lipoprotein family protein [Thermoanaerobaculia bacterium]